MLASSPPISWLKAFFTRQPTVTIGMPLYNSVSVLDETVDALLAQTYRNFRVVMSVDGNDTETAAFCEKYLGDPRFELTVQTRRLGWVGNLNWCMQQTQSPFFQYWQHDDLPDPTYIEKLVALMRWRPKASIVYCDVQMFGESNKLFAQPTLKGTPLKRAVAAMEGYWTPFRGLVRADCLRRIGPIRTNAENGALEDIVWVTKAAREGALVRLPETLYQKRVNRKSASGIWNNSPDMDERKRVWAAHGAGFVEALWPLARDRQSKWKTIEVVFSRLVTMKPDRWMHYHVENREAFASLFLDEINNSDVKDIRAELGASRETILQRLLTTAA